MNGSKLIEKKISLIKKIKPFNDNSQNINTKNNYTRIKSKKSRNNKRIKFLKINISQDKKFRTDINDNNDNNKKNDTILFRTSDTQKEYNTEGITILSETEKYCSVSYDKIKTPKKIKFELNPLIPLHQSKKSAGSLTQLMTQKYSYCNLFPKKISSLEIKGNTEIIATTKVRKISNLSENALNDKKNTNVNYVLNLNVENNIQNLVYQIDLMRMKNENKLIKNIQLDSIEEVLEDENDLKTKSKNNTDRNKGIFCDNNFISGMKYNSSFSNEKEMKNNNNMAINTTGISTIFGTGKYTNNIFDIPSDEENNINYIENNDIENEKENQNKTITDYEHDTDCYILNPIKPNENDNSVSFMNVSDINKLFFSPSKKGINDIDYNNLVINNKKYNNTSILNKKNNSFDELVIKIPHINNNFKQKNINNNVLNNTSDNINYTNKTYVKKTIKKTSTFKPKILKNLISPKNLNKPRSLNYKIKEIKLSLKKNIKKFVNDNQIIKKINKNIFEFDTKTLKSLTLLKNKIYIKTFKPPLIKTKPLSLHVNSNSNIEEIDQIRKNNTKENISFLNIKNYNNDNDNFFFSTQNSDNIIKKEEEINQFNLSGKNNENIHSRNRSRNKIDQNNSLFHKKSSLLNLSNGYNTYEINKGNSNGFKDQKNKFDLLNNIYIKNDKKNQKDNNYLSFASNNLEEKKFYISVESYEEFIKNIINQTKNLMDELLLDNNSKLLINIQNKNNDLELDNLILSLEKQIKKLKNNYLCVLIQKHYSQTRAEKINVIKNANIQNKREIFYNFCQNMLNKIKENKMLNDINKKTYINKILQILKNYKTINKFDIKYTKKIYKEENKITPEILDERFNEVNNIKEPDRSILKALKDQNIINNKIVITTTVIIPILYGINYLMYFYNNYK